MNTDILLDHALFEMEQQLRDKDDIVIPGRMRLQLFVRKKGDRELSGKEEQYYYKLLETLNLTEMLPFNTLEVGTDETDIIMTENNQPICLHTILNMMQTWVCCCLGEEFTYQVALDDIQHEAIKEEYGKLYGCTPEESGLSPRAGSVVVELISNKAKWLAIQVNVTCVSALGAMRDMEIVEKSINGISDKLIEELRDEYDFVENGRYPNDATL